MQLSSRSHACLLEDVRREHITLILFIVFSITGGLSYQARSSGRTLKSRKTGKYSPPLRARQAMVGRPWVSFWSRPGFDDCMDPD